MMVWNRERSIWVVVWLKRRHNYKSSFSFKLPTQATAATAAGNIRAEANFRGNMQRVKKVKCTRQIVNYADSTYGTYACMLFKKKI